MANPKVEYEIHSKDKSKEGISSASKSLSNFGNVIGSAFKGIAIAAGAITGAMTAIGIAVSKVTDIYGKQEKAEIKLYAAAMNNPLINGTAVRGLMDYASALQTTSEYGDEALIPLMAMGVAMGHSQETIKGVSEAAIDLAAATGMSLDGAFKQLYKTFGGLSGELGESIPAMRELTAEQLKAGAAVELIKKQYGGLGEAVATSTAGIKEQTKNIFGDMMEDVGSAFAPLQNIMLKKLQPVFNSIGDWFNENGDKITNFFLHFGEIARLTFARVKKSLEIAFSWEGVVNSTQAIWAYIKSTFISIAKFLLSVMTSIGVTLWTPIKAGLDWVIYGLKVAWTAMINGLASGIDWLVANPINAIAVAFKTVVNAIGEAIQWILNGIITLINGVIDGLNMVIKGAHDATQTLKHPLNADKREKFSGGIGQVGKMNIEWLDPKKHERLTSGLLKFVSKIDEIPKPTTTWHEIYDTIKDTWVETAGVGKETITDLFSSLTTLGGELAEPFKLGFAGFTDKFIAILEQDLPPEAQSAVAALAAKLDELKTPPKDVSWDAWVKYLKEIWAKMKTSFNGFVSEIKTSFGKIKQGLGNTVDFIKGAFHDPKAVIAQAGFALVDIFKGIGGKTKQEGEKSSSILGNIFNGLGSTMSSLFSFITDGVKNTEGFQQIMEQLNSIITTLFEHFISPLVIAVQPLIDAIIRIVQTFLTALQPAMDFFAQMLVSLAPVVDALRPLFEEIGNLVTSLLPIIQSFVNMFISLLLPIIDVLVQALQIVADVMVMLQPVFEAIFNMVVSILTPIIEFISHILKIIAPVLEMISQILVALAPIFEALGVLIGGILGPALEFIANLIGAILAPVITIITDILTVLAPIFNIFAVIMKAITPIFSVLFSILNILLLPLQILSFLIELLNPIFEMLAAVLVFITPVFEFLGYIVDAVTRPFEFLGDLLTWLGEGLKALGQTIWYLITFQWDKMGEIEWPSAFDSDAFDKPLSNGQDTSGSLTLKDIVLPDTGTGIGSGSPSSPGAGATYGSPSNYHINVTVNAEAIIGEPGLEEFALMINDYINSAVARGTATR